MSRDAATVRTIRIGATVAELREALKGIDGNLPVKVSVIDVDYTDSVRLEKMVTGHAAAVLVESEPSKEHPNGCVVVVGE